MDETRKLASYASGMSYEKLPQEVIDKAKILILDQLGVELAGSTLPWSKATYRYIRDIKGPREESIMVNFGLKTLAQDAAFANASFGRTPETDDSDPTSSSHLGSIVIPSALAVGEKEMIGGKQFLEAVVTGYEVASRIGGSIKGAIRKGFHSTTLNGPFGAAAASSKILALSEEEMLNAISIAGSHASGLMEYSETGGSVNRLHAGIAAYGGIRAAMLAQRGFSGPPTVLEGRKGFCGAFGGEPSMEEITRGLGKEYKILGIGLRRYCCCGTQNAGIDAVSKIVSEHQVKPKDIEEITVRVPSGAFRLVGTITEPKDMTSAQFSGRYGVALRLVKGGNSFKHVFNEANLRDPEILALIKKTTYVLDEELDKLARKNDSNPTKVTMRLKGGTVYEETVLAPRGTMQNPFTEEERLAKFRELASMVLPDSKVERIIETVNSLEKLDNIWELGLLLVEG